MMLCSRSLNTDFVSLAVKDPDFAEIYSKSPDDVIDFQNPAHLK